MAIALYSGVNSVVKEFRRNHIEFLMIDYQPQVNGWSHSQPALKPKDKTK